MKKISLLFCLLTATIGFAQITTIDFETNETTAEFVDFDGGTATIIPNPQANGSNTSSVVAQIVRDGGQPWAGSKVQMSENVDFSTFNTFSMQVFSTAPAGTVVKFKLEGNGEAEADAITTTVNEWETLTWDFTGQPANFSDLVFMFDFGNVGDGSATSTFLFDDIQQVFAGEQIDLPVTFEGETTNYTTPDFGGNISSLVEDPTNSNNTVCQVIKTDEAATWSGTTIGTPAGFATDVPLTLDDSKMYVRVWSPEAGTPIRLKVEDSNDPTHTCETQTNTTVGGEWEVMEFDFATEAPGTAALSFGLQNGWTYNMASIFFNFGTEGATVGEKTYYFDNVSFSEIISSIDHYEIVGLKTYPNPTTNEWLISTQNEIMTSIEIYDLQGKLIFIQKVNSQSVRIPAKNLPVGTYIAAISTQEGTSSVKLVKK